MRNISFSLTTPQFRARTKTVTRRLNWLNLKAEDELMGCEKCQGIKPGEQIVRLGPIRVVSARREPLDEMIRSPFYGVAEAVSEGFPGLSGAEFVAMFCKHMGCLPTREITRIEFEYL